jgi:hypothetical protein
MQDRFCYTVQKLDDWVVRIGIDPGQERPDNNDPHIKIERDVQNKGGCAQQISKNEHKGPRFAGGGSFGTLSIRGEPLDIKQFHII